MGVDDNVGVMTLVVDDVGERVGASRREEGLREKEGGGKLASGEEEEEEAAAASSEARTIGESVEFKGVDGAVE